MTRLIRRIAATMLCLAAQATLAGAADLNVYSTTAMRGVLEELVPQFQKQSGKTLALTFGTATMLAQRIGAGEPADVAILTRAGINSLNKDGKLLPGSDVVVAQSIISVGIKRGAHKPDISTAESPEGNAARCKVDRLFRSSDRRRKRRSFRQAFGNHGHRRRDEAENKASAAGRQRGSARCHR